MQTTAVGKLLPLATRTARWLFLKPWLMMKLTFLLLFSASLYAGTNGYSQTISLSEKNTPLEQVLKKIEKQSGYSFLYRDELLKNKKVTLEIKSAQLTEVLDECFKGQGITYEVVSKMIVIKALPNTNSPVPSFSTVTGRVLTDRGEPAIGITVMVKGTSIHTNTNTKGEFSLTDVGPDAVLLFSGAELEPQEITVNNRTSLLVRMVTKVGDLDQVIVQGYGITSRRYATGNIGKVTAAEIERQSISDPLAALQGRIPGLLITQSSGISGSSFSVELRGKNSILNGTGPFFIVDGVPFANGSASLNNIGTAAVLSPFNMLNPADIESIEVLKDADATAIYGSRGANGVVLITTKSGKQGRTRVNASVYTAFSRVSRTMELLDTPTYVKMRREAFANDNLIPTTATAPDLLIWDTSRNTNWKDYIIGGTAQTLDAQLAVHGGTAQTQFRIGAGYRKETTVFPTDLANHRATVHMNLQNISLNKRLTIGLTSSYAYGENKLTISDLTTGITAPPNVQLINPDGSLKWEEGGLSYFNAGLTHPFTDLNTRYIGRSQTLNSSLRIGYKIAQCLNFRANLGYNLMVTDENRSTPSTAIDPYTITLPYALFSNGNQRSWIIEPQLEYTKNMGKGSLTLLTGTTWQNQSSSSVRLNGQNYTSDLLLNSIAGAGQVIADNYYSQYRYAATFGRLNYTWDKKYIANVTGRRDGSSRFGPEKRLSSFYSLGGAWLFSNESFTKNSKLPISFGKLRASYGLTGNDQIGDYKFLDTWSASSNTYQEVAILSPTALFNPELAWESNRKFEAALDLGLFKDRVLFSISYFRNLSGNQLVNYALPTQTGFSSVTKNFEAKIENRGWEFQLNSRNISTPNWSWSTTVNLTQQKNKLMSFPDLANSSYANNLKIGYPTSFSRLYHYTGVDPETGIHTFEDLNRDGVYNSQDYIPVTRNPTLFGGMNNTVSYKNLELSVFLEFRKQQGYNYLRALSVYTPGYSATRNQPVIVMDRWQTQGEHTGIQKFTASPTSPAFIAASRLMLSDAIISDASYLRCKTVSLAYNLPAPWLRRLKIESSKIYFNAQNLFVITKYKGSDPEVQNLYALPTLRTLALGIQLTL